jgi:hypothetical protein
MRPRVFCCCIPIPLMLGLGAAGLALLAVVKRRR